MTNGRCDQCNQRFDDGQDIWVYQCGYATMEFCDEACAGVWFVDNECKKETFHEEG